MNPTIVQGVGYFALLFVILSFQLKSRAQILLTMLTGVSLFVVHYSLLHAWTGAILNLLEAAVVFVAYQKGHAGWAGSRVWPYIFSALFVAAGLMTARSAISTLPVLAQIAGTAAVWQTQPARIRALMLIPRPLWFTYNFAVGSQAGMIAEIFIFVSVTTGIIRLDRPHKAH